MAEADWVERGAQALMAALEGAATADRSTRDLLRLPDGELGKVLAVHDLVLFGVMMTSPREFSEYRALALRMLDHARPGGG